MAVEVKRTFSGILSQSVVVCLLALFVVMALVAMFSTAFVGDEVEWIGMTAKCLDAETAARLGIPRDMGGVMVGEVDGMAQKAGIRHADVLVGINGHPVRDMVDFSKLTAKTDLSKGGVQLDIIRRGTRMPLFVSPPSLDWTTGRARLPGQTAPEGAVRPQLGLDRLWDRQWLGVEVETLAAREGREFGVPAGVGGVLIEGVTRGSLAEQVGLAVDDIVVSVNGQKVDMAAGLWNALAGLGGGRVDLGVYRRGRLMSIALPQVLGAHADGLPAAPAAGQLNSPVWGRMGGWGLGPGGTLVCPNCRTRVIHQRGVPRYSVLCPSCGTPMVRTQ